MTDSLGSASGLSVQQRTILHAEAEETGAGVQTQLSETLTYRFSNAFRSETVSSDLTRIHVDNLDGAVTIIDDRVALQDENRFDRYKDLLLFHSRLLLQERLSLRGIDTVTTSLGRFDGVPVYVLGAQYPDMTTAQIWIDKETFWPLRLLFPMTDSGGGVSILEFRYLLWQKHRKLWYPMRIECYENEQLVREMVVEDLTVDPQIADGEFDVMMLRARHGDGDHAEEDAPEVESDIQKALDDFKKRYE
jgi:outer membrane lipoprotein-sorting protein